MEKGGGSRRDMCIIMADSPCCMAETTNIITFLKSNAKKRNTPDNKIELPSEIYFKNTYLGISLLWKGTDLYYFSWKPLFRAHGIS